MTAQELKRIRRAALLTQQQLADLLRVDRVTVTRWETGALPIAASRAVAIDAVLTAYYNMMSRPSATTQDRASRSPIAARKSNNPRK